MASRSILKFLSALFIITLITINGAFYVEYGRRINEYEYSTFERFIEAMRIRARGGTDIVELLKNIDIKYTKIPNDELRAKGKRIMRDSYCDMIFYKNSYFFVPREFDEGQKSVLRMLFLSTAETDSNNQIMATTNIAALENTREFSPSSFWILLASINLINLASFGFIWVKILELRRLKTQIKKIGENSIFTPIKAQSDDELGAIAAAFNSTMSKVDAIKEARALFLRNILHELRTPVMKGKLIASMQKDSDLKEQLARIFTRQEVILNEIVKIEKFSSNEWELARQNFRLIDIIDHAKDLLFRDTSRLKIKNANHSPIISVDFELFTTAVKNLLDNALKYSKSEVCVEIYSDKFDILNSGAPIATNLLNFDRAFNRKSEISGSGLGLGLYIANQIFTKHGFSLKYKYLDEKNCFIIEFNKNA